MRSGKHLMPDIPLQFATAWDSKPGGLGAHPRLGRLCVSLLAVGFGHTGRRFCGLGDSFKNLSPTCSKVLTSCLLWGAMIHFGRPKEALCISLALCNCVGIH